MGSERHHVGSNKDSLEPLEQHGIIVPRDLKAILNSAPLGRLMQKNQVLAERDDKYGRIYACKKSTNRVISTEKLFSDKNGVKIITPSIVDHTFT